MFVFQKASAPSNKTTWMNEFPSKAGISSDTLSACVLQTNTWLFDKTTSLTYIAGKCNRIELCLLFN